MKDPVRWISGTSALQTSQGSAERHSIPATRQSGHNYSPHGAQNELDRCVSLLHEVQADCNCRHLNEDRPDLVSHADGRYSGPVEELKDIYAD